MAWKAWDWKFVVMLVATLAGLVIPVFLWQIDLSSRSLTVRLLSTSPLQPASNIQNLQVSVNGQNIESPYLSTFELVNDGSKPIPRSDFETPIEVVYKGDGRLVSAQITGTSPPNIPANISSDDHSLSIDPFLSNPKDSVSIAVITSGPAPRFQVQARIAGISEVSYENTSAEEAGYFRLGFTVTLSAVMAFLYCLFLLGSMRVSVFPVSRALAAITGIACGFGSIGMLRPTFELISTFPHGDAWRFVAMAVMIIVMMFFAHWYI